MPNNTINNYKKKTILQVVPALVSGGVERGTIDIAIGLKKHGYECIVVSGGGQMVKNLKQAGILHIKLNVASKNPFVIWNNTRLIIKIIKKYKVDIIHARSRAPAWSCYRAAKKTGKKFVTTFHGIYNISSAFKRYYNSIMTKGAKIIAVSNFVKQHILYNYKVDPNKIYVIYRGVDANYFDPANITQNNIITFREKYNVPKNLPVILLPSRMTSWKGHLVLVDALNQIKDLKFYCLMVGDLSKHPEFAKRVRESIVEKKLQSKIQIFGNELDILKLYGICDIILSTSIEPEAFGRTVIEGQAMEKLVIATNIGGTSETIVDNVTGYHVDPNDAKGLAEKIAYCLELLGTTREKEITTNARNNVIENFSLEVMVQKILNFIVNFKTLNYSNPDLFSCS